MKNLITYSLAATLVAGAAAHQHQHQHNHARRHGSRVQKRGPATVTEYVVAATETVYELNGEKMNYEEAQDAINNGKLVVVGESNPTYQAPPPAKTEKAKTDKATLGAQFYEEDVETEAAIVVTTTTAPAAPKSTKAAESTPAKSSPKASTPKKGSNSGSSSGQGVDREFESGTVLCSEFPSEYGAVALDWLELGGWSGIQYVPKYDPATSSSISEIHTGIPGNKCTKGAMCSYACPAGYQKTQWPSAQGSTKESIGGLYCNSEGYLELTREGFNTLCESGVGGVSIQNDLDESVATCRTDYPGTENMVIPAVAEAGGSVNICNPEQEKYYIWDGSGTSAQYYINKKGLSTEDACIWTSSKDPKGAGNWAPLVLGVGRASDGITYVSIFQNLPTSTALLDFNVEILGGNSKCSFIDGKWTGGSDGCTTGMKQGGKVTVRYF